ncbi:MAG: hypothetical protein IPH30_09440 [Betaproteobacteria bacterium]|nr:hypothetical protein [Betaproteobacteria bacterium]
MAKTVSQLGPCSGQARSSDPADCPAPGCPSLRPGGHRGNFRRSGSRASAPLGPNGDALAIRVERCKTPEELRVALREAETILTSFLGAEYGRTFAQKIGRDLL